jgi:hypothetical protein
MWRDANNEADDGNMIVTQYHELRAKELRFIRNKKG